jgi:hypothetical protein
MDLNALDAIVIAVIIGLIEGATRMGLPKRFAPVVAVVLGVAGGLVYIFPENPKMGVLVGLVMGLSAVGLYSGTKNILGK